MYSKKKGGFAYVAIENGETVAKTDRRRKIPYAGAAKSGWRKALRTLGEGKGSQGGTGQDLGMSENRGGEITRTIVTKLMTEIENLVSYAPKTAPTSAIIGVQKATNRMKGTWLKQFKYDVEAKWRAQGGS